MFEPLTGLTTLTLAGNPGAAGFAPQAVSGPAGGFDAVSGGSVTLGVEGAAAGQDDPWGSNVTYAWSLTEGTGGTLTAETAARADFAAPVTAENGTHTVRLTVTGAGGSFVGTDDAAVRVAAGPKVERVSFATLALSAGGPAYTADGVVSVTLGFDRAVTVTTADGTPSVSLTVGTATKTAGYLNGTGTRSLTFGYTVVAADTDTDGVDVAADSLALNGGRITGVSDGGAAALGHAGLAGGSDRPVNGSGAPVVSGGICGRTAAVQAAVLARVRTAADDETLACGAVTPTMLTALAGRLDVSAQVAAHGRMTALKAGDFAWLANVTALDLDRHALRSFPVGVFDGLAALQELSVAYNQTQAADRMTTLPVGLFDRLTKLTTLRLEHNDLETLPDGIFERLTRLSTLTLDGNPGSASFLPVAVAGPAGGFDAEAGDLVTLGGAPGGPWGGNLVHAWRQVAGPTEALSASNAAAPSLTAPALGRAVALEYELTATGRGTRRTATDSVTVRVAPSAVVASLAAVSGPVSGDTYRRGETIGVAVTFGKPVAVTGTPQLALSVGTATRQAAYAHGTGTTQLAFEYTVVEADRDPDGIAVAANALALNNGTIADAGGAAADLGHGALAAQSGHKVDGSLAGLTGGICGRTPGVRDALLVRVRTVNAGLSCAQVTITHLGALTGTLSLPDRSIRALRPGDFTGLANVTALDLGGNELASLPAGVFAGLDDTLTSLDLSDNDLVSLSAGLFGPLTGLTTLDLSDNGLAALPTGLFGPLTGLTTLDLSDNGLAALPARLFEQLTGLTALTLSGNPGSARFRPVVRAGPEGGIDVAQGATVTLGTAGAAAGFDDPWGSNVAWAWTRTAGTTVSYASDKGADTARPEFTAPSADETMTFTLTVTGKGGITATDTVSVRVGTAGMRPMPKSAAVNGETLTLIYDEVLQTASPVSATGKGPVYLAVVGGPGAQRSIESARPTAATASGRTVTMTLDPPAASNETVTLSYYPDNATADSSVRDRGGNLANGFTGFQVRNVTAEGPGVLSVAFAGAGKTYGIGDMVEVDVTFSEAVTVTGRPTLALEVGAATRKAGWKIGQGAGAVQRFEYTVAAGDADSDGVAAKANGLEAPSGSSIVTVSKGGAVSLRHASHRDPAHKVDGVLPTAMAAPATLCEPTNRELWCGTMTVGVSPTKGGYSRSEGLGAITPGSFAWRGATVNVTELSRNLPIGDNSEVTLQFSLEVASGAVPSGGILGSPNFVLWVGIGNHTASGSSINNPGTKTSFSLPVEAENLPFLRETLHWYPEGVEVQVQLIRRTGGVLGESIVSDPGSDKTYAAGETITVQLEMTESVFVTGRPHIWLDVGGVRRKAVYSGPVGTAATELDFSYTVRTGDSDTDGVAVARIGGYDNDIQLNGGSIRMAVDETDSFLELVDLGPQSGHKVDAAEAFLSSTSNCESEVRAPPGWALTPSGLNAGDKFRLLFVTSTRRDASSVAISPYNVFVQDRTAAGHGSIRPFRRGFLALGSNRLGHARDRTCTTGTGVPIHWLGGNKVADSYTDFYDGSWDDRTNWRDENGNALSPGKVWTGSNDNGTAHSSRHMGASMVAGSDGASSSANPLTGSDGSNSEQRHLYGLSQVFKVATSTEGPSTSSIELTGSRASGDIFGLGESVGIEVTFSEAVTVRGSPRIGLSIGEIDNRRNDGEYEAAFVGYGRTDGNADRTKLIFGFVVPSGLHDTDGIEVHSTALRLKGGEILARLDGLPARWTIAASKNLGGSVNSLLVRAVGVCDRTPAVSTGIVAALSESEVEICSQVTTAHLAGMTTFSVEGLTSLAVGDFAGLSGLQDLTIHGSGIGTLPVGLFDGLASLEELFIQMGLTHLPKDIFRGLGKVRRLRMEGFVFAGQPRNYLRAGGLPDGIFEPLADVTELNSQGQLRFIRIFGNPGYPAFFRGGDFVAPSLAPRAADAGPGGTLSAGQTVTLGGPGNDGGIWGSNVAYLWQQRDGMGAAADIVTLSNQFFFGDDDLFLLTDVPNPGFTAPALAEETEVRLSLRLDGGRGAGAKYDGAVIGEATELLGLWSPVSEARFTILGLAPTDVAVASKPVSGTSYRLGEAIEVAVTFGDRVLVDTSQGTPTLALTVGTQTRQASYVRGTGTTQLVFAYTVVAADSDTDGIAVAADALALNGGAITSVYGVPALLDHDAVEAQSGHGADGSQTPGFSLTGGVCGRTGQVRDKLVDLVNDVAANSAVTNCSLVTETHLGALTGTLDLSSAGIAALKAGDFAGLGGISVLNLNDNALPTLPARVFEPLTGLTTLTLAGNPGAAGFAPQAVSGPAGGFDAVSGGSVTLGVEGAAAGQDDPWGSNVTYAWSLTEGTGGTLTAETAARADFAAPVTGEDANRTVRLTVTGAGGSFVGTDDATVRVAAGPKVERVSFATPALSAGGPAYTADGVVSVTLGFDRAVTVATADGTPSVSLTVGTATKTAGYLSGTGTRSLTFGYTVVAADTDTDGVDMAADSLALNGGRITGVPDGGDAALGHAGLAGGSERPVNGSGAPVVSGGICGRTAAVQAAILARVRTAEDNETLACGAVTPTMLTALAGRLDVSAQVSAHGRMTALKAGDFAWLANVTALDLDRHALRSFPAGVFDGLAALQELSVAYNQTQAADRMTTLPAGLFDRLTKLTTLGLEHNDLVTLPDGIFERLTRLTTLTLDGNPGSASFLPVAVAGPMGGFDAEAGDLVTLGGAPGGPWGGNLVHAWRQVAGPTEALSASNVAAPSFTAPALGRAVALEYELTATGRGTRRTAADSVTVRVAPSAVVASLAAVSGPVSGDTYRRGETIGVAVTFGKPVAVTGTPQLALSVGSATRQAAYARGTGTTQLVFEYTVVEADRDPDGIAVAANALALNNGTIADADAGGAAADLGHDALTAQSGHKVDGSLAGLTGGICGRTPEVRDALLVRVRTVNAGLSCAQVTITHLGALTGTLSLPDRSIRALRPGDFAGLANVTALDLGGNELASLPAGVFAGLDDTLTSLDLSDNDLVSLSAGLFGPLTGLTTLDLSDNDLAALPARLFEQLTGLTALTLSGNPGSARFRPIARAGPEGGIDVVQGATVTLGTAGAAAGFDDPWGTNVTWAWTRTAGTTVSYASDKGADTARPEFTAPSADETMTFALTVTGKGGVTTTDTVSVRVGTAGMRPMPKSAAVNGATLTLTYDEDLQTASPAPASGKGPVYLAVVRGPGAQRSIATAHPTAVTASGRTVTITLDPPAEYNQSVTLSYYPDNATADSSVRDRGGNLANGFTGFQVRNDTPEGPHVDDIAFAGAGKTYGIDDKVEIDVTFSEAVTVTGRPTLGLDVGVKSRKVGYVSGSGSAVLRFEYTVAADDLDTDGLAVKANGLETPSGSSIVTVAQAEAVILRHGSFSDPAHKVDGVLPTATAASVAGPTVTVTWSEALDEAAVPTGAGGFTVRIATADGPAVTAVAVSGSTTVLSLASAIADGTQNVTLEYAPPGTGAKIRDAVGNDAAAILRADPLAVEVTPDTRAPEVLGAPTVDGDALAVTFDEALDVASVPAAPGGFTVTVTRGSSTVSGHTVSALSLSSSGTVLTLTLSQAVRGGDAVTLAYAKPSTPLRDRATTPNDVADFTTGSGDVLAIENRTPSVKTVAFAGAAQTYAISDPVAVDIAFTQAVRVTATSSARPELSLTIGANTRKALYVSGTGSATLHFEYEIVAGDEDNNGIAIPADALSTPSGSSIVTDVGDRTVQFGHDAVAADPARKVDGVLPTADTAAVAGPTVTVTWSEALDEAAVPTGAGGFTVRIATADGPAVTAVAVSGSTTVLSLASAIADGTQSVTLEYAPPDTGAKIRDVAGNDAAAILRTDPLDVTVTPDTRAPEVSGAPTVDGDALTVTFDEALDAASVPAAPGGFTVTVTRGGSTVSGHTVSALSLSSTGTVLTLTLTQGVLTGDAVALAYAKPSTPLRDRAVTPNDLANFTTGSGDVPAVINGTGALELALSKATAVEGDDATITLTVAVEGSGTSGTARVIAVAASGMPTATESSDWTLQSGTGTLETGAKSVAIPIAIVDDARLEAQETVTFAVTADGAAIGTVTLTIDDDDRAVLAVVGPGSHVTEGGEAFTLKLRLEPHSDNGPPIAEDACFLDFPVTATLSIAGGASELTGTPTLPGEYNFPATASDCTREVTVNLETRASDGNWTGDRAVSFALARKSGQDARIDPGEAEVMVLDDTSPPGPLVVSVDMPAAPSGATELTGPFRTRKAFYDRKEVPDDAVHGEGAQLTFTLTFDEAVTVEVEDGRPELVLDVWKRDRRARLTTPTEQLLDTRTLTFAWTVAKGDNDPDGIRIAGLDLKGARIRFEAGCQQDSQGNELPCDIDLPTFAARYGKTYPEHRVRGGLHSIALSVSGGAREGQPFTFAATRDGGYGEEMYAIVQIEDSAFPDQVVHRKVEFAAGGASDDGVARTTAQITPQGDGAADPNGARQLTLSVGTTEVGSFAPACVFVGDSETCTQWYDTPEGEDGTPVTFTVAVADTDLAANTPSLAVRDAYGGGVQEPSQEQVDSGTDAPLSFHVVLSKASDSAVTVDYTTRNGTAIAEADYDPASGTLTFQPGETFKTVDVRVLPDSHDEGSETMSLALSNAGGAAIGDAEGTGTIFNSGPIPKAWIARFGRTVADQVIEAVDSRMRAAPAPGAEVGLGGYRLGGGPRGDDDPAREARLEDEARQEAASPVNWLEDETDPKEARRRGFRAVTPRDVLMGSSFEFTSETKAKGLVSLWGRSAVSRFNGREGNLSLDGEVVSGMLGADWIRGRSAVGLILSHSTGVGGYAGAAPATGDGGSRSGTGGRVEATLTGLFPWGRYALSDRLEAWGTAGYGAGDLTVTPKLPGTDEDGAAIRADLDLKMTAAGLRGTVLDGGGDGLTLTVKTDSMAVQTASGRGRGADGGNLEPSRAMVTQLRLGVDASRPVSFSSGAALTPSLELGLRHDGGDAESGFGLDLGGALAISDPRRGLQAEIRGRGLLAHQSKGFRDLGFSGSLAWEGKPGLDRGPKLSLTQTIGGSSSGGADALLSRTTLDGLAGNDHGFGNDELKNRRLDLKFGYGLPAFHERFVWTPEVGVGVSDTGRDYSLGWNLVRGAFGGYSGSFELSFEARRRESANDYAPPEHEVGLRLTARF